MGARISKARRAAFIAALAATGNRRLAAERARVSGTWARDLQATDPSFRADVDAAVAAAAARLERAEGVGPRSRWRDEHGQELTVRGAGGRWTQVAQARLRQWTPRAEARFLSALAASGNVRAACRAVGLTPVSAYRHRRRWPAFGERWDMAVQQAYDRIATALVASAGKMLGEEDMVPDAALTVTSVDDALRILRSCRPLMQGEQRRGRRVDPPSMEQMRPQILRKLQVIERAIQAGLTPAERVARQAWLDGGMKGPPPAGGS